MRLLILIALSLLFLTGALGLRYDTSECDSDPSLPNDAMKMQCYHAAALTRAYLSDTERAREICEQVWTRFGDSIQPDGSDLRKRAELTSNACYLDVARISRDPGICAWIRERDNFNTRLFGDRVTYDTCLDEVGRLAQLAPENYYSSNPNNLCAIVFVLPLLAVGAIKYSK